MSKIENTTGIKDFGHPEVKEIIRELFSQELSGTKTQFLSLPEIKAIIESKINSKTDAIYQNFLREVMSKKSKKKLLLFLADYLLGEVL